MILASLSSNSLQNSKSSKMRKEEMFEEKVQLLAKMPILLKEKNWRRIQRVRLKVKLTARL